METFNSFIEAEEAAEKWFADNFGDEYANVGIEEAHEKSVTFYSKHDPGMSDVYSCKVDDGKHRFCANGGTLRTVEVEPTCLRCSVII